MVLVKMLMEIDPLPMRGSSVMTIVMISPSQRKVSPAEQLRRRPRLVPPRGGGVSSRKLVFDFFSDERLHIAEDGHWRATRGPTRQGAPSRGGRAPRPRGQGVAPLWYFFRSIILINSKNDFHGVSGLLELRRIGFQYLLFFQPEPQLPPFSLFMINLVK